MIRRAYATTRTGRRLHYRRAGSGPPLVLLHGSRGSSWSLEPLLEQLAARHTVLAFDSPGYGESEPLPDERPAIADYSAALAEALAAVGIARCDLYGTHTGAKIAIDFALHHPAAVRRLVLDGLALYTPDEREAMIGSYTPSLHPVDLPPDIDKRVAASSAAHAAGILEFLAGEPLPDAPDAPKVAAEAGVVRRDYASTRVGQLLMRKSGRGSGRPLLLFHGSPGTSRQLEPLLVAMGRDRPVCTFDTPGLGDSAPPPAGATMTDVAAIVGDAIDELGLQEFDVYGTRTGSCTGIELAIARPQQVRRLIVDGPVMFTSEYVDWLLTRYLPVITPDEYGAHLLLIWNFRRDQALFWPWFEHTAEGVRGRLAFTSDYEAANLTGEALHRSFADFIKAALTYHVPYRAGIAYPTRERLPLVTQPVLLCTNEHDVFRPGMAEARTLPQQHDARIYPDPGPPESLAAAADLFRRFLDGAQLPALLGEQ